MIRPIKNNVVVKCCPSDEISSGGIIVPASYREDSNKVEIIAVGNGTMDKPMKLKEGQIGFRVKAWGTEIIINNEKHFLMDADSIIAINE